MGRGALQDEGRVAGVTQIKDIADKQRTVKAVTPLIDSFI